MSAADRDPDLPLDPDVADVADGLDARVRPLHLTPRNLGLVFLGGAVGTGLRFGVSTVVPHWSGVPIATLAINVVGAFVLGLLLEALADHDQHVRWARRLRLTVGTGLLGGFTTYSALATDTALLASGSPGLAVAYALATVLLGGVASAAGIRAARIWLRPRLSRVGTP